MFTIQYIGVNGESRMQTFDSNNRAKLIGHLARFEQPILAVYEQSTVITKAARADLAKWTGTKSRAAKEFCATFPAAGG